jgi:hypothetical protein
VKWKFRNKDERPINSYLNDVKETIVTLYYTKIINGVTKLKQEVYYEIIKEREGKTQVSKIFPSEELLQEAMKNGLKLRTVV